MEEQQYYYGTGRRKTSVARVRIYPGNGAIVVNGIPYEERFTRPELKKKLEMPFVVTDTVGKFTAVVKVEGGGYCGQGDAIVHGIARALVVADESNKPALRQSGLLSRDPRQKERKKPGLRRARKAPQYTKR